MQKPNRLNLTKSTIDRARYEGTGSSRHALWDTTVTGLGLRVYPSGRKSFVLSYRPDHGPYAGQSRLMVLGEYGSDLTLAKARERAIRERGKVIDGRDPLEERKREAQGETFGDLMAAYIERWAKVRKKSWRSDERRLNRHIPTSWKRRKVTAISREKISELHASIGADRPYAANRLLENLSKMFALAVVWGFAPDDSRNPTKGVERFSERKRKRFVTKHEMPALAKAIDAQKNVYVRAALWLYLLTGLRRSELLNAQWQDIDWHRGILRLPETKAGEEQAASLNRMALAILQSLPRIEGNQYIIAGAKPGAHLVQIDKPWRATRKLAGLDDVRLHDLRRTTGSWLAEAGVDLNRIKDALRHASINTTLTYARLGANPSRQVFEDHGKQIMEAAGKTGPTAVAGDGQK